MRTEPRDQVRAGDLSRCDAEHEPLLFVEVRFDHPLLMLLFLVAICTAFCLMGFVIGIWAGNFEQLQIIPMLIVTPLTFLGGAFYSVDALAEPWRTVTLLNPIVYLVSGFRWTFYSVADVPVWTSVAAMAAVRLPGFCAWSR